MSQGFSKIGIIVMVVFVVIVGGALTWQYLIKPGQEADVSEENGTIEEKELEKNGGQEAKVPSKEASQEQEPQKSVEAWEVYEDVLEATGVHDLEKVNSLVYEPYDISGECVNLGLSEDECWNMLETFVSGEASNKRSDYVNINEDKNQIVMSSSVEWDATEEVYSKSYIYFVSNPKGDLLLLTAFRKDCLGEFEECMEMARDTDQDGLVDEEENCSLKGYDPECVKTNPSKKDTDGDGWWDSIELEAGTDPNDANKKLTF